MLRNVKAPTQSLSLAADVECAIKKRKGRKKHKHHRGIASVPATVQRFEYRPAPDASLGFTAPENGKNRKSTVESGKNQGQEKQVRPWWMLALLAAFLATLYFVFGPTPRGVTTTRIVKIEWRSFEAKFTTIGGDDTRKEDYHAPALKDQKHPRAVLPGKTRKRHYHKVFRSHHVTHSHSGGCRCRFSERLQ